MIRLFTALWPPPRVVAELDAVLSGSGLSGSGPSGSGPSAAVLSGERDPHRWPPEGWRAIPHRRWHVTLCFHGDADPGVLARRLDSAATGLAAPWLRLAGAVSFGAVIAVAVHHPGPQDASAMAALVSASGADQVTHRPHVSVARTSRRSDFPPAGGPLERFTGMWWRPREVCLVRSEISSGSPRYTVLHRVPLHADPARDLPSAATSRVSGMTRG